MKVVFDDVVEHERFMALFIQSKHLWIGFSIPTINYADLSLSVYLRTGFSFIAHDGIYGIIISVLGFGFLIMTSHLPFDETNMYENEE